MSRPVRYIIPAAFLSISLVFTGCKTIYSDTYSPRRNHFIPLKVTPKTVPLDPLPDVAPSALPPADAQGLGLPPSAPPSAPTDAAPPLPDAPAEAPMIPGL